jgi:hypothetical protein
MIWDISCICLARLRAIRGPSSLGRIKPGNVMIAPSGVKPFGTPLSRTGWRFEMDCPSQDIH